MILAFNNQYEIDILIRFCFFKYAFIQEKNGFIYLYCTISFRININANLHLRYTRLCLHKTQKTTAGKDNKYDVAIRRTKILNRKHVERRLVICKEDVRSLCSSSLLKIWDCMAVEVQENGRRESVRERVSQEKRTEVDESGWRIS